MSFILGLHVLVREYTCTCTFSLQLLIRLSFTHFLSLSSFSPHPLSLSLIFPSLLTSPTFSLSPSLHHSLTLLLSPIYSHLSLSLSPHTTHLSIFLQFSSSVEACSGHTLEKLWSNLYQNTNAKSDLYSWSSPSDGHSI